MIKNLNQVSKSNKRFILFTLFTLLFALIFMPYIVKADVNSGDKKVEILATIKDEYKEKLKDELIEILNLNIDNDISIISTTIYQILINPDLDQSQKSDYINTYLQNINLDTTVISNIVTAINNNEVYAKFLQVKLDYEELKNLRANKKIIFSIIAIITIGGFILASNLTTHLIKDTYHFWKLFLIFIYFFLALSIICVAAYLVNIIFA